METRLAYCFKDVEACPLAVVEWSTSCPDCPMVQQQSKAPPMVGKIDDLNALLAKLREAHMVV